LPHNATRVAAREPRGMSRGIGRCIHRLSPPSRSRHASTVTASPNQSHCHRTSRAEPPPHRPMPRLLWPTCALVITPPRHKRLFMGEARRTRAMRRHQSRRSAMAGSVELLTVLFPSRPVPTGIVPRT
jgi:hypothetical protein